MLNKALKLETFQWKNLLKLKLRMSWHIVWSSGRILACEGLALQRRFCCSRSANIGHSVRWTIPEELPSQETVDGAVLIVFLPKFGCRMATLGLMGTEKQFWPIGAKVVTACTNRKWSWCWRKVKTFWVPKIGQTASLKGVLGWLQILRKQNPETNI